MTCSNLPLGLQDFAETEDEGKTALRHRIKKPDIQKGKDKASVPPQTKKPGFKNTSIV